MDCRLTKLQARRSSIARPSHSLALTAASAAILGAMITLRSKKQRSLQQGIADFYDASTGAVDPMWVRFWPGAFMCCAMKMDGKGKNKHGTSWGCLLQKAWESLCKNCGCEACGLRYGEITFIMATMRTTLGGLPPYHQHSSNILQHKTMRKD